MYMYACVYSYTHIHLNCTHTCIEKNEENKMVTVVILADWNLWMLIYYFILCILLFFQLSWINVLLL